MKEFKKIEFQTGPNGFLQVNHDGVLFEYKENDYDFTQLAMAWLEENYPDAVKYLEGKFKKNKWNRRLFEWSIVTNFFSCKCGALDDELDIDADGEIHVEHVNCPIRSFCEDKICRMLSKYKLTDEESKVIPLLADGMSHESIGIILGKNANTIKSTINRACKRFEIQMNGKVLVAFCRKKGLL